MCRFVFYLGAPIALSSLITEPVHSLIHQSAHSEERSEPLNGDGFGVAWYAPETGSEPARFRSITPAWNNANLEGLSRAIRSHCILAHVRAASPGSDVSEANCHPFRHGRLAFMHNGDVGAFPDVRRRLLSGLSDESFRMIRGNTDSEHVFALFLDALAATSAADPVHPAEVLARALVRTIREVVDLVTVHGNGADVHLNLVVTDGADAVVSRFATDPNAAQSLYVNVGRRYTCCAGRCQMEPADKGEGSVVVSSEPLTRDAGWEAVPANHLVVIRADGSTENRPCP